MSFPPPKQFTHLERPSRSPYVPIDNRECLLLGPTALVVQGLMGGLVIISLLYKRHREKPMRPWRIWLFDVSKQILGQAFVHGLNLLISDVIARVAKGNPCDLYFLNVLIDTTIGVGYIYLVLHASDYVLTERLKLKGFRSGQYGDPPSTLYWIRQASIYVVTILTMKLLIIGLFAAWPGIFGFAEFLLSWTDGNASLQVIFVMGIFPIIMNVVQFWLIDSIVKASTMSTDDHANEASRQPLFHDPGSDSDEDIETIRARRKHDIESPPTPQTKDGSEAISSTATSSTRVAGSSSLTQLHMYPPSLLPGTSSPLSASSIASGSSFRSKKSTKRRSPPPPIQRPPPETVIGTDYTISTTPSPMVLQTKQTATSPARARQRQTSKSKLASSGKLEREPWDDWTKSDDWAEKVGEDDWTGRRVSGIKAGLEVWGSKGVVEVT